MENRGLKVGYACFAGGVFTVAVLIAAVPGLKLWGALLGLFVGALVGYLAYDFREVWRTFLEVWKREFPYFASFLGGLLSDLWYEAVQPRWRLWTCITLGMVLGAYLFWSPLDLGFIIAIVVGGTTIGIILVVVHVLLTSVPINIACFHGGNRYRNWLIDQVDHYVGESEEDRILRFLIDVASPEPGHITSFRDFVLLHIAALYAWALAIVGVVKLMISIPLIAWRTFRYIHSNLRVLCAVDGVIGGGVTYWWFRHAIDTLPVGEQLLVILLGGTAGCGLGLINYYLISRFLLRAQTQTPEA